MKTTLNINDELLLTAKAAAVQQRTTLTRLIEEGLNLRLRAPGALSATPQRAKFRLPVLKATGGLVKGVNPLSNKAMLAALEDDA
jgi:hypothetical protein